MMAYVHLWWYFTEFFFECEVFQTNIVEKNKTHFIRMMSIMSDQQMHKFCINIYFF
jgi:hypothetical protein